MSANKVMLIILDGWGLSSSESGNAPLLAKTPTMDYIYSTYPKTSIAASGLEVGLSEGEPGNSEVGHTNIGSGRIVWENLPRIDQTIKSGEFFANGTLLQAMENTKKNKTSLHLIGLVSDGGVHSHIRHLMGIMELAKQQRVDNVYIHLISDGRDTAPKVVEKYIAQLEEASKKFGGRIVDLVGRYYAMDRDNNWDRSKKAFDLFVNGVGEQYADAKSAVLANYKNDKADEIIEPSLIGEPVKIKEGDSVIFFNHRSDRSRQMMRLFTGVEKAEIPPHLFIVTMTEYEKGQSCPVVFPPLNLVNTLCDAISEASMKQFHTAETEKYAHVTYFLKAGNEQVLPAETDKVVPSKKISYDQIPEMSAPEVTEGLEKAIENEFEFIVVNYANGDMVGHTGVLEAAIKACEALDRCLAEVLSLASAKGYKVLISADHGNCDVMIDEITKEPNKEHTTNPVPLVFLDLTKKPFNFSPIEFSNDDYIQYASGTPIGVLADLAPSVLANLELKQPEEMTGMDLSVAML